VREPDGRYLFALSNAADQDVAFLRTTTPDDLMNSPLQLESAGFWDPAGLGADQGKWSGWNMINFVRGSDGSLYLLAGDNVCHTPPFCEPFVVGSDWIRLFRVMEASPSSWTLSYVDEKQLETEYPQMGNLKAASGVYVSPTGQLIVYTGHHDRFFQDGVWYVAMGEFRNFDVHVATSDPALPPQLEEIDVNGDGLTETSCSGWAEFYVHAPAGWDDGSSSLGPSVMLDYRDRHFENWDNLAQLPNWNLLPDFPSLNDEISSLRWNLPPGQQLLLYEHAGFGGLARLPIPEGTGRIGNLGSWWNDQISSIHLTALADAGSGYYGSVGTPIPLTRANPCYGADDLDDMSFEWAMSASEDECVPDLDPPCSLVNPTDLRPQVTCSAEGVYWIRLRVTENYGANTDVREDCTYVTVPEPGRIMLLASAISGLVLLSLLRRRWTTGAG
jgi:hypothetical protein